MGNYLGYSHAGSRESMRLGTNGSGFALLKLFAVAYASSGLPDERRARSSVIPMGRDTRFRVITTRPDVQELLAKNDDGNFWADFHMGTAGAGFFAKPPGCDTYRAILVPLVILEATGNSLLLPPENVEKTSAAWRLMLPHLEGCPAIRTLTEITKLAEAAAQRRAALELG